MNPNSVRAIKIAGKAVNGQKSRIYLRPTARIEPHSGVGGCTPRPIKLRPEIAKMHPPIRNVASTITGDNSQTLRNAQEHPEDYRNLVVRIAGYSAYFVELGRSLQDDIISRNENML